MTTHDCYFDLKSDRELEVAHHYHCATCDRCMKNRSGRRCD